MPDQATTVPPTAAQPEASIEQARKPEGLISHRAILLGLALVPLNCYWVIVAELRWYFILTLNPLFVTPIFYLFVLVLLNAVTRRVAPRWTISRAELVVIYVMLVMSCTIATHDFIINLMSTMSWPRWFATPENNWQLTIFPHLPKWLVIWDKRVLEGFFNGSSSLYGPGILKAWLAPLGFWSLFIFSVGWIMLCLNVLLRKAWTDEVRLSYPIVRLPLALTEGTSAGSTLRSSLFWFGFAAAALVDIINGIHEWIPNAPYFPIRAHQIDLPGQPWSAAGFTVLTYYPFAIGLAFLVPLDVSFSCWFFYLFMKAQSVVGYTLGYGQVQDFPFVTEQAIGAWVAFGISLLYLSRHHLARAIRIAFVRDGSDRDEPMSYRLAFFGLLAGMLVFFVFWWAAGFSPIWAIVVLASYLLLSLCITRVRAEAGGQHTVWDLEPRNLFRLFSSRQLGPANLAAAAVSHWYWRLNRSHVMPSQLEAFKLAQENRMNLRSLVMPMVLAFTVATVAGMWSCLHVLYRDGGLAKCVGFASWTGQESYDWLDNTLKGGFKPETSRWAAVGGGATFIVLLSWLRSRYVWFPFHPLGYCIGPGLVWLWCPFLIAWLVKLVILRYGGLRLYRKSVPFFLGLVLGDYTIGAIWSLVGAIWHVPTYQIFH